MRNYFNKSKQYNDDCYVADYTNATDSRKGIVISTYPFDDIAYFHLKKRNPQQNLPYIAVNLEEYPTFIKDTQNCECIFASLTQCDRPWLLLLETKYCEPDNIEAYAYKACAQMEDTLKKLETLKLVDRAHKRVYFVYSVPGLDDYSPFAGFTISQNETLKLLTESGITVYGFNTVLIATPQYLMVPQINIM